MDQTTQPVPVLTPQQHDPLAVAFANASLFGVGYLLLGKRLLAGGTIAVTLVLLTLLATVARTTWFEIVVLLWWAVVVAHGWYSAGGRLRRTGAPRIRRHRRLALGVTIPVLLIIGLLRWDASRIEQEIAESRGAGDCPRASAALSEVWAGHHVADAPMTARGDDTARACRLLLDASAQLDSARLGDVEALRRGFDRFATVLAELPGHETMTEGALDGFLAGLPTENPCYTKAITDELGIRPATGTVLDRAAGVVPRLAPSAIVDCGDDRMAVDDWEQARTHYRQLLDQYPGHELAARAEDGAGRATRAIELANVRELLAPPYGDQPEYCSHPAPYSGAAPAGGGRPNPALIFGNEITGRLPAEWRAREAADAVLVVCADDSEFGTPARTCPYESDLGLDGFSDVTFRRNAVPVRVYELRTGRLISDTRLEIGGTSCPDVLHYTTYFDFSHHVPPSEVYVDSSDSDVRTAFEPLVNR